MNTIDVMKERLSNNSTFDRMNVLDFTPPTNTINAVSAVCLLRSACWNVSTQLAESNKKSDEKRSNILSAIGYILANAESSMYEISDPFEWQKTIESALLDAVKRNL